MGSKSLLNSFFNFTRYFLVFRQNQSKMSFGNCRVTKILILLNKKNPSFWTCNGNCKIGQRNRTKNFFCMHIQPNPFFFFLRIDFNRKTVLELLKLSHLLFHLYRGTTVSSITKVE